MKVRLEITVIVLVVTCWMLASCRYKAPEDAPAETYGTDTVVDAEESEEILMQDLTVVLPLDSLLQKNEVAGSVLVFDASKKHYYSNNFQWAEKRRLPASTFKITNSIVALETGVVSDENDVFKWNGEPRRLKIWEQDLTLQKAFHYSCVPCYQQVARSIGTERMNAYLTKLNYGQMEVSDTNIDLFWLQGNSGISQFEQINFLKRFHNQQLPLQESTYQVMKRMMILEETDSTRLRGKTGWSIRNGRNNGWFVGYLETNDNVIYFATNIDPQESFNMDLFPKIRKEITMKALEILALN